MSTQKSGFLDGEGDAWHERNRSTLNAESPMREQVTSTIASHLGVRALPARVLEIGCGQGQNLAALARHADIEAHGIEPSPGAVEAGRRANPALHLRCGTADVLPYAERSFDVVWFGFCLYLVDRDLLSRCVAEADRVLAEGGLLCIVDFDPGAPCKRPYHHREGMWSYKMDYSALFLSHPAYCLVHKASLSHSGLDWHPDPQERVGMWLCRKDSQNAYRTL